MNATNFLVKQPTWSLQAPDSSKVHKHVIVRNHIIEVSDNSSDMEISPSPAPGLGASKGKTPTAGEGSTKGIMSTAGEGSPKGIMSHTYYFLH
jgi:hypothetical protein